MRYLRKELHDRDVIIAGLQSKLGDQCALNLKNRQLAQELRKLKDGLVLLLQEHPSLLDRLTSMKTPTGKVSSGHRRNSALAGKLRATRSIGMGRIRFSDTTRFDPHSHTEPPTNKNDPYLFRRLSSCYPQILVPGIHPSSTLRHMLQLGLFGFRLDLGSVLGGQLCPKVFRKK